MHNFISRSCSQLSKEQCCRLQKRRGCRILDDELQASPSSRSVESDQRVIAWKRTYMWSACSRYRQFVEGVLWIGCSGLGAPGQDGVRDPKRMATGIGSL